MAYFPLPVGRPAVMGILNVTPDSFSDGGRFFEPERAIAHGLELLSQGADLVDVGGVSTRPGSEAASEEEELRRVVPVVAALVEKGVPVSVDTYRPEVARQALRAGACVINDVWALRQEGMAEVCAEAGCSVCLMHMQGEPGTMQAQPCYRDVVAEVRDFLLGRAREVEEQGVARERIWIDPGIGFGKSLEHNLALLRNLDVLVETGYPVLLGASRKAFIGALMDSAPVDQRLEGTLAVHLLAQASGARVIRVHDVREVARAARVAAAVLGAPAFRPSAASTSPA